MTQPLPRSLKQGSILLNAQNARVHRRRTKLAPRKMREFTGGQLNRPPHYSGEFAGSGDQTSSCRRRRTRRPPSHLRQPRSA